MNDLQMANTKLDKDAIIEEICQRFREVSQSGDQEQQEPVLWIKHIMNNLDFDKFVIADQGYLKHKNKNQLLEFDQIDQTLTTMNNTLNQSNNEVSLL